MAICGCDRKARSVLIAGTGQAEAAAPPASAWHALRVRSRCCFAVRDQLRGAAIEEFLPTYTEESRWSDRIAQVTRPLFPGYIFARFNRAESARVLLMRGAVQILGLTGPEPIPDDCIASLRKAVEYPARVAPCPYVTGATVRVRTGPFAGVSGVVARVRGETILTIPVEILGRAVSVQIDATDCEPCETSEPEV